MATGSALILGSIGLLLWWTFASRLAWKKRAAGLLLLAASTAGFFSLYRYQGVSGDLIPVFEFRWGAKAELARGAEPIQELDEKDSFPQFRGPARDGVLPDPGLAIDWKAEPPRMIWRRPVGTAWSGFAIARGRAITQEQHGSEERVVCYDLRTGDELWRGSDSAEYRSGLGGDGPRATPTIVGDHVYTVGARGDLNAWRLEDGERSWSVNVIETTGAIVPDWGFSGSPLFDDGRIVVAAGGEAQDALLVAYDAISGERLWNGGADLASYGSPKRVTLAGRDQIVMLNHSSVTAHDPETGAVLWTQPFPSKTPNVSMPIPIGDDRLLVSSGYGVGSKLYRVSADGDGLSSELVWKSRHLRSKFANLLLIDGFVYGLNDGVLACLDPETGDRRWRGARYGHGQLLQVGERILAQTEEGEIVLIDPDPEELREITRFQALEGKVWNPPALAGALLLVRSDQEAVLYELPLLATR